MEEEEALRNHCRRMISLLRSKQQHIQSSDEERGRHKGARGSKRTESSLPCQGPEVPPVPPQLMSTLRLKTFEEQMRRAAEVELHDPAVCGVCEQEQASLALTSFISRKKTQLQFQTLQGRLNTHLSYGEFVHNLPKPLDAPHWIWEELLG